MKPHVFTKRISIHEILSRGAKKPIVKTNDKKPINNVTNSNSTNSTNNIKNGTLNSTHNSNTVTINSQIDNKVTVNNTSQLN